MPEEKKGIGAAGAITVVAILGGVGAAIYLATRTKATPPLPDSGTKWVTTEYCANGSPMTQICAAGPTGTNECSPIGNLRALSCVVVPPVPPPPPPPPPPPIFFQTPQSQSPYNPNTWQGE